MSADNPTAFDDEDGHGCILCRCDTKTQNPVERGFMYAACVGMAAKSGISWIAFSNACRNHQLGLNNGTNLVGDMLLELVLDGASPEVAADLRARMRSTRKLMAELDVVTLERYEARERELEKRGE